ncbi:MAG: Gfo/Idh/MocA family oxidoreductase [Verrucomicrobiae bacterium]|nr:Gfo/Idh/MocA family oxidoreductase [Verrucomicrobiae bacterium]
MIPLRIGVIGAGGITRQRHLPGLMRLPGIQLVAVCNRTEASSTAVAKEWGFARITRTPRELLEAKDVDAVFIGTWPYLHHILSNFALRRGKHVFTQARMACNLAEAKLMLREAAKRPHLVAMICSSPYAMGCALYVQKLIAEGFVGKVRLLRFHSLNAGLADPDLPIFWRQQARLNGVNTLSLGIILERLMQWVGPVTSVRADGTIFTPFRKDAEGKPVKVDAFDQLQVIARLRDHPGQMALIFSGAVHHGAKEEVTIHGDAGTLVVRLADDTVLGARAGEKALVLMPTPPDLVRGWNVEADFVDAIRAGGVANLSPERRAFFPPDFAEGVRYMAVTEAVIAAAKSGREQQVDAAGNEAERLKAAVGL